MVTEKLCDLKKQRMQIIKCLEHSILVRDVPMCKLYNIKLDEIHNEIKELEKEV